jgi:hypothetical protein
VRQQPTERVLEALAIGLAFGGSLCWLSTCLVGSFRPQGLRDAYWADVPWLHTDTLGIIAFAIAAVCLPASEYLRLQRRAATRSLGRRQATGERLERSDRTAILATQAVAEAVAILATLLVGYLSVNAVTHPATLLIHATHVLPWPSEGTLRVVALLLTVCAVSALRFFWSGSPAASAPDQLGEDAKTERQVVGQDPDNSA